VPPSPKELTLILSCRLAGHGNAAVGTTSFASLNGTVSLYQQMHLVATGNQDVLLGFGLLNLMFGGIVLCSKARIPLITLVIPEAPSE
jgi:hypothetical protein